MDDFAGRLRVLMAAHGIKNVHQLALQTGLAEAGLSRIMNGHRQPGRDTLTNLAQFFNVSVDTLTGRLDPQQADAALVAALLPHITGGVELLEKFAGLDADAQLVVAAMIEKLAGPAPAPPRRQYTAPPPPKKRGTGELELRILGGHDGTRGDRAEETNPEREALR